MPRNRATINVRGIDAAAAIWIKRGAAARGITIGEYLARLSALHDQMRQLAETDAQVAAKLTALGLQAITA